MSRINLDDYEGHTHLLAEIERLRTALERVSLAYDPQYGYAESSRTNRMVQEVLRDTAELEGEDG